MSSTVVIATRAEGCLHQPSKVVNASRRHVVYLPVQVAGLACPVISSTADMLFSGPIDAHSVVAIRSAIPSFEAVPFVNFFETCVQFESSEELRGYRAWTEAPNWTREHAR